MGVYDYFVEKLKDSRKQLLKFIAEANTNQRFIMQNANETRYTLHCLMSLGYPILRQCANNAIDNLKPKVFFFIETYPSVEKYCSILSDVIKEIDAVIENEEKAGVIFERLSKVHISLPSGETDPELEKKIRQHADAIARIIS